MCYGLSQYSCRCKLCQPKMQPVHSEDYLSNFLNLVHDLLLLFSTAMFVRVPLFRGFLGVCSPVLR